MASIDLARRCCGMSPLRVIFFDAVGTLIYLPQGAPCHYQQVARRHGLELPAEALDVAFRRVWKQTPAPRTTRVARPDDDRSWWEGFVDCVLDACVSVEARSFDRRAYFAELYDEFAKPGVWATYPETGEVLTELAARYELGVISNFDRRLHTVLEQLRLTPFFREVVISSEVGANKPDPWIFAEALRLANVPAAEALHVGDDPAADWEGAARTGMRVYQLERSRNSLRELLKELSGA